MAQSIFKSVDEELQEKFFFDTKKEFDDVQKRLEKDYLMYKKGKPTLEQCREWLKNYVE